MASSPGGWDWASRFPRGQFNAFLAAAEATGPGEWTRLSAAPLEPCPQLVDVDFPAMAFTRAEWVDGNLHLRLAPLHENTSVFTSFVSSAQSRATGTFTASMASASISPRPA